MPAVMVQLNTAAESLWPVLSSLWAGHVSARTGTANSAGLTLEVLPRIESTNSELMRRARAGQTEPTFLVAAEQTMGRGRMGKTWISQSGQSLTFSALLPFAPGNWSGLSLAVGVSLAESLGTLCHTQFQLKWPNDLWHQGRKVGGILVETAHAGGNRCVVVGVGLNIATPELDANHPGVAPLGLREFLPALEVGPTWTAVAPALLRDLLTFEREGFAAFARRFAQLDALLNQPLWLSDGTQGVGGGVDFDGALLVRTPHGGVCVHSNEVSVRPLSQATPC
jgi:BirA family biotin operon repressor/biotin-[acetyl-CoA-carboxylase] ligase